MWGTAPYTEWDKETLRSEMMAAIDFATTNEVRMMVGEFAAIRTAEGADQWYADCIALFEEYGLDWTLHGIGGWSGYSVTYPDNYDMWSSTLADGGDRGARWQVLSEGWELNTSVPEPTTLGLIAFGTIGIRATRRRRQSA
jgi:endoglucanase